MAGGVLIWRVLGSERGSCEERRGFKCRMGTYM